MSAPAQHKLKVLHILASSASGGVPSALIRLMQHSSFDRVVICPRDDEDNHNALAAEAIAIYDIPIRRISLATLRAVLNAVSTTAPDVIHTHGKGAGLYGRLAGLILKTPVVHTYHGFHVVYPWPLNQLYLLLERVLGIITSRAIAVSKSERDKILAARLIAADVLTVQHNPIELTRKPCAVKPQMGPGFNVVSLARLSPQKDMFTLLRVAQRLRGVCWFHVIGGTNASDRAHAEQVRAFQSSQGIDNVRFYGDAPNASALLRHFDAYVSTALWEGLPTAMVEAFLSGVPVVGTDCVGNIDLIRDDVTGVLCPCGDDEAMASALSRLLSDRERRLRLANAAKSLAAELFDAGHATAKLDAIYTDVVFQSKARASARA